MLEHFSNRRTCKNLSEENNKLLQENQELKRENLSLKEQCLSLATVNNELLVQVQVVTQFQPTSPVKLPTKPIPKEDENNVVIFYNKWGQRAEPDRTGYLQSVCIDNENYFLSIYLVPGEGRTWEIKLENIDNKPIPKGFSLKAVDDKGQDFIDNEIIATEEVENLSLWVELEEGEGLKILISPEPDADLDSKIFWFY